MLSNTKVKNIKRTDMIIKIVLPFLVSPFRLSLAVSFRSEILKAIAMLTSEKHNNVVVKIFSTKKGFSISIKNEENIVRDCPNKNIGMKKKKNFVQIYLLDDMGEVLIIHKEFPSEATAG